MAQEKIGNGTLMINDKKIVGDNSESNQRRPSYTGPATVTIAGVQAEYEIAAWLKVAEKDTKRLKKGDEYYTWTISEKWKSDVPSSEVVAEDNVAF